MSVVSGSFFCRFDLVLLSLYFLFESLRDLRRRASRRILRLEIVIQVHSSHPSTLAFFASSMVTSATRLRSAIIWLSSSSYRSLSRVWNSRRFHVRVPGVGEIQSWQIISIQAPLASRVKTCVSWIQSAVKN